MSHAQRLAELREGDRVNWLYQPPGGYGYAIPVAAIVLSVHPVSARIMVARKQDGKWVRELKLVNRKYLSLRNTTCEELGE